MSFEFTFKSGMPLVALAMLLVGCRASSQPVRVVPETSNGPGEAASVEYLVPARLGELPSGFTAWEAPTHLALTESGHRPVAAQLAPDGTSVTVVTNGPDPQRSMVSRVDLQSGMR